MAKHGGTSYREKPLLRGISIEGMQQIELT